MQDFMAINQDSLTMQIMGNKIFKLKFNKVMAPNLLLFMQFVIFYKESNFSLIMMAMANFIKTIGTSTLLSNPQRKTYDFYFYLQQRILSFQIISFYIDFSIAYKHYPSEKQ